MISLSTKFCFALAGIRCHLFLAVSCRYDNLVMELINFVIINPLVICSFKELKYINYNSIMDIAIEDDLCT